MAVRSSVIVVPATPGGILVEDGTSGAAQAPVSVMFWNPPGATVFLGGPDVTPVNGLPIAPSSFSPSFDLFGGDQLFAIVAAGTQSINVFKTRA